MKHLFVPYELALLAKEKGFNETCLAAIIFNIEDNPVELFPTDQKEFFIELNSEQVKPQNVALPLYQQLVDWFRDAHKIHIEIKSPDGVWKYLYYLWPCGVIGQNGGIGYNTYYEALTEALTESFKLI